MATYTENGSTAEMTVGRSTNVHNLAVSIAKYIGSEAKKVRLVAIGANAVNQMVKGAAKSRAFLAPVGKDILWKVYFTERTLTEEEMAEMGAASADGPDGRKDKLSAMVMESWIS